MVLKVIEWLDKLSTKKKRELQVSLPLKKSPHTLHSVILDHLSKLIGHFHDDDIWLQLPEFRTCQPPPREVGGSRKAKEFSENQPLRRPKMKLPNLYQRSAKHHDHYRRVPTRENANGSHQITLRVNLLCNGNSWFYFIFDMICMSLDMICISKKAISFHPSISIKANGITSHYSGQPQTSSYNQGTYKEGS